MINRKRTLRILWLIIFAIALSSLMNFLEPRAPDDKTAFATGGHDYRVTGVKTTKFNASGKIQYRLQAKAMTHFPDKKSSVLIEPVLQQYNADGSSLETRADEASLADDRKIILMRKNVVTRQVNRSGHLVAQARTNQLSLQLQ